jgi:inner membrane protein
MPSVGHVAIGLAAARIRRPPAGVRTVGWAALLVVCSCLPDLNVIAFSFGIPYQAPFGHRGAVHSLVFAAFCGLVLGLVGRAINLPAVSIAVTAALMMASHGLLDTLTDGGLGIALLWPFSNARYFAPWRPIPVAPIGPRLFAAGGIHLMLHECILFLPFFIMGLWPRSRSRGTEAG